MPRKIDKGVYHPGLDNDDLGVRLNQIAWYLDCSPTTREYAETVRDALRELNLPVRRIAEIL